ncbi:MAG: DUF1156 domain-containing protein [Dehalococcoidia bacterium]
MITKKKLIEVALPLDAINKASAREKSIRHGHPSTLHLWWARRPLAAARAVIFAQMVDDPSANPDLFPTEKAQERERERLFKIIEDLVLWENTTNEIVLEKAREEIWQSWRRACAENADHPHAKELFDRNVLPAFHDPFAGGGSLPLEAQRLGLEAHASDLNPVAVLINKAMIEIPPKFADSPPVNPKSTENPRMMGETWRGARGLAEDVRHYGQWMRDEAEKRIGDLYPAVRVTAEMARERQDLEPYVGKELTVVAWLWARTVKSPNPAFATVDVPLASTFVLSRMKGNEAYVEPLIEDGGYRFTVKVGQPGDSAKAKSGTKLSRGANFKCLMSDTPIAGNYIKAEGRAGRMGARLMAIVAEGQRGRVYLPPTPEHETAARNAKPDWAPEQSLPDDPRSFWTVNYGLTTYGDLFSPRQLVALTTFSDLVAEVMQKVRSDALAAGFPDDPTPLRDGGAGAKAYAESLAVYVSFAVSGMASRLSTICVWDAGGPTWGTKVNQTFGRQTIPMSWDFAEANPFSTQSGSFGNSLDYTAKGISQAGPTRGSASQADAAVQQLSHGAIVSTDPPYYDNIGYADLSDFFYVWLRRSIRSIFPDIFATLAVPKDAELIASQYRHSTKDDAEAFFLDGMTRAMQGLAQQGHPSFPVTIYYAFKQTEGTTATGAASTGWETFLEAVIRAGFGVSGTWPVRTELSNRLTGRGTNALASSIVLVCRKRTTDAPTATRREFVSALRAELPAALRRLQEGNIAPVDLAQAAIGPGMGVYTRFARVLDAAGEQVGVREALALINEELDATLAAQEGDFDADTRWAVTWFEQHGYAEGEHGVADVLAKAKNTSTDGMQRAGILIDRRGKVRLLKTAELAQSWDPETDSRLTVWEMTHHLIRALEEGGEAAAAALTARIGTRAEVARELAYRLYTISERRRRAADALAYNGLVQSWPEIVKLAQDQPAAPEATQAALGLDGA